MLHATQDTAQVVNEMGFEGFGSGKWSSLARHKRSSSFPDKREAEEDSLSQSKESTHRESDVGIVDGYTNSMKKHSSHAESMRQEILLLEKRLRDQVSVRSVLEKALGYNVASHDIINETSVPQPATELIKEIAVLELEVSHLEQYLLSLYRKAYDQQISSSSPPNKDEELKSTSSTPRGRRRLDFSKSSYTSTREYVAPEAETRSSSKLKIEANGPGEDKFVIQRSNSSVSQSLGLASKTSLPAEDLGKALRSCYSQPLSMMEYAQNASSHVISLAEHLGTRISDHIPDTPTPNKLSEEMVKCMADIYCKLADPPLTNHSLSSPASSLSSMNAFSPKDQRSMWSPGFRKDSSFDARLDNPFHIEGLKDFSGPYSTMVEVTCLYRDSQKLSHVEYLLQNFRSLVSRLEAVDPKKMVHEEKLAFWINVHNSLVMHAVLAYGVPQNNVKRMFLLLKAAYNVGGQIVSADAIQSSILGCRLSRPGQWLRFLLSSRTKFKAGDERKTYAIEHPEHLLYFALSSGSHSDPAIRVYTPKSVFQELEVAKEDYIRATFGIRKDHKIVLPKIIESFAKDSGLCHAGIMEMIRQSLPESLTRRIKKRQLGKTRKDIVWVPHNFAFRYLIRKDLVN